MQTRNLVHCRRVELSVAQFHIQNNAKEPFQAMHRYASGAGTLAPGISGIDFGEGLFHGEAWSFGEEWGLYFSSQLIEWLVTWYWMYMNVWCNY